MDADDFRDYMLSFLFLRYLSDNYETAAKKELAGIIRWADDDRQSAAGQSGTPNNVADIPAFEKQMRRKVHYVIQPAHLWNSIAHLAWHAERGAADHAAAGLQNIERESFSRAPSRPVFSEIDLTSKLGKTYPTATPSSAPSSRRSPKD